MSENRSRRPIPGLNGLILCGGKSRRMQTDKSLLEYRDIPHWQYIRRLLEPLVEETWISCRKEQATQFGKDVRLLFDRENSGLAGPAEGMLAAHERFSGKAWLVVACDLPFVSAASISVLINTRNPNASATAFLNPDKNWPEPLLAIWEPAGLQVLARNAGMDRYCPRKTLEECAPALAAFRDKRELFNANTPADRTLAEMQLRAAAPSGKG